MSGSEDLPSRLQEIARLAELEPYATGWDWDERPQDAQEFALALLARPDRVKPLPDDIREKVVWNLAAIVEDLVRSVIHRGHVSDEQRFEILRLCPAFLAGVYEPEPEWSESAYMWWDGIVGRPDPGEYGEIGDVMFEVMVEQLGIPNRISKFSGLHGLNHLQDPRTRRVVDEFQMAHKETDRQLYEYCMYVKRFEAL
ncbi:MAG: hypothetical protein WD557_18535 [Dehalococcoidia bacterium]